MSDTAFPPLGIPGRSSNTSGNVGLAGSALLPTITAELRSEFYPLLSTLARSGSGISAAFTMELFFALVRFDAILHAEERHLFVSTAQQLISAQLQQLQTVHHKVQLLEENLVFVEELIERCAALEALCGNREEEEEEGDDEDATAATAATTTTAPNSSMYAGEENDDGGEAGSSTSNTCTTNCQTSSSSANMRHAEFDAALRPPRRVPATRSSYAPSAVGLRKTSRSNAVRSTASNSTNSINTAHRRRHFSFDEDLADMVSDTSPAQTPKQTTASPSQPRPKRSGGGDEDSETPTTMLLSGGGRDGLGGDTNTTVPAVSASAKSSRQRHLQRPPPLPLSLVSDATASRTTNELAERRASDNAEGAADHTSDQDTRGSATSPVAEDDSSSNNNKGSTAVAPEVFVGVQHALQEHFRRNVKRTLTGASRTAPASLADLVQQQQQLHLSPRSGGTSSGAERSSLSPGQGETVGTADAEKGKAAAEAASTQQQQQHGGLSRHAFSVPQVTMATNNSSSTFTGLVSAASGAQPSTMMPIVDRGGPLAVAPLASLDDSPYSLATLEPVDTARVWDRVFWGFLDGRTATADLAVLLSLLNDGNTALTALQASEKANRHATGGDFTAAAVKGSGGGKAGGAAISGRNRLAGVSVDTIARSPRVTAMATPDCGTLPLMEALKHTGSYADLMPMPKTSNLSIVSMTAGATAAAAAFANNNNSNNVSTVPEKEEPVRPISCCTADAPCNFPGGDDGDNSDVVYLRGGMNGGASTFDARSTAAAASALPNSLNIDSAALRPRQWVNLDDYVKAEEARLHRDFWTHIPAILLTLCEGVMYGDSRSAAAAGAVNGGGGGTQHRHSKQRQRKGSSASTVAAEAGGEVANALYDPNALQDSLHVEDDEVWEDTTPLQGRPSSASAGRTRHSTNTTASEVAENTDDVGGDGGDEEEEKGEEGEEENTFVPLHPPSAEALQLLRTFSPLLRNYSDALGTLLQAAPEYARSAQAQHARALASVAAQQHKQQQQHLSGNEATLSSSGFNSDSEAGDTSIAATAAMAPDTTASRFGVGRAAALRSSIAELAELRETFYHHLSSAERRGTQQPVTSTATTTGQRGGTGAKAGSQPAPSSSACAALPEAADLGLLGEGSRSDVRAVDVVLYALVTAVCVQCAVPIEHQRNGGGEGDSNTSHNNTTTNTFTASNAGTNGRGTALPFMAPPDRKASLSESGRSPAGSFSPQTGCGWPAGDGGTDSATEDERALNRSVANGSISYNVSTVAGGASRGLWWNPASGAGRNAFPSNTSFGPTPHLSQLQQQQLANTIGSIRFDNASFALLQQMPNVSFDLSCSPTEAALSLLRTAHEERANGLGGTRLDEQRQQQPAAAAAAVSHASLLSMLFPTQDVLGCANAFSWVSLPSLMKAELQNLHAQLTATRYAVVGMEGQVRGELALLLFRLLSTVLDWLMPAVNVAEPRIWLFYRKWCCDLYRVLCTDLALLDEFRTLLNQSGVAAVAVATSGEKGGARRGRSRRRGSVANTAAPTYRPLRGDEGGAEGPARTPPRPTTQMGTPVLSSGGGFGSGGASPHPEGGTGAVNPAENRPSRGAAVSPFSSRASTSSCGDRTEYAADHNDDDERDTAKPDLLSYILPGSGLVVSVSHVTAPTGRGVLHLLAQEEADRREDALVDNASLHAAQALLSDEGKVIPLPKPFLITKLVAATLRGIDADIAESMLWVVGGAIEASQGAAAAVADGAHRGDTTQHRTAAVVDEKESMVSPRQRSVAEGVTQPDGVGSPLLGAAVDNVHSTAQWKSQRPRHVADGSSRHHHHLLHTDSHGTPMRGRRTVVGAGGIPRLDHDGSDGSDSESVQSSDRRYDGARGFADDDISARARHGTRQQPPAPAQSPVMSSPGVAHFPVGMPPSHSPLAGDMSRNASTQLPGGPQLSSVASAVVPEGPMLVHHHRFRYPSVSGYADVALLYLSTLEDAELLLSPHDPIYASLVLSTADLHLHDLHDRETAASLVKSYLADVGEEQIQGPVWDVLPTALTALEGAAGLNTAPLQAPSTPAASTTTAAASGHPPPGRGFSVTRVRQGNGGGGAGGQSLLPAGTSQQSSTQQPQQQQPHVPVVIASWNNEREKDEFLATLRVLRQIQVFLTDL